MLYKRKDMHKELCIIRVSPLVLDKSEVIITDGNAASEITGFWPSHHGLSKLKKDLVFAEFWTDDDQSREWNKKRVKCAEVLVPDCVEPHYIKGAYTSCDETSQKLRSLCSDIEITINPYLFFL